MERKVIATVKVYGNPTKMSGRVKECGTTQIDISNFSITEIVRWMPHILEVNYIRK